MIDPGPAPTVVRVIFSQTRGDYVTASLRHATGPLIVGEWVAAFEVDEPSMWAWAEVMDFDTSSSVALLSVDHSAIVDIPASEPADVGAQVKAAVEDMIKYAASVRPVSA